MSQYELGVIGAGNMAEALLRGVISGNFLPRNAIVASDPVLERRELFTRELKIACVPGNAAPVTVAMGRPSIAHCTVVPCLVIVTSRQTNPIVPTWSAPVCS